MAEVLIDANVVYGFRMSRDQWHDLRLESWRRWTAGRFLAVA